MEWISVEDKKPKYAQNVFVWDSHKKRIEICVCYTKVHPYPAEILWTTVDGDSEVLNVKYWMPIKHPKPPKETDG